MNIQILAQQDGIARPGRRPMRALVGNVSVSGRAARVYSALVKVAGPEKCTNVSSPRLGELVKSGRPLVCNALRELEEVGLIRREFLDNGARLIHLV